MRCLLTRGIVHSWQPTRKRSLRFRIIKSMFIFILNRGSQYNELSEGSFLTCTCSTHYGLRTTGKLIVVGWMCLRKTVRLSSVAACLWPGSAAIYGHHRPRSRWNTCLPCHPIHIKHGIMPYLVHTNNLKYSNGKINNSVIWHWYWSHFRGAHF